MARINDRLPSRQASDFEGVGAVVVNAEDPLSQPLVPDQTPTINFALQNSTFTNLV